MLWGGRGVELSLRDSALHSRSVIHLSHMTPPPHGSGQGSQKKHNRGEAGVLFVSLLGNCPSSPHPTKYRCPICVDCGFLPCKERALGLRKGLESGGTNAPAAFRTGTWHH